MFKNFIRVSTANISTKLLNVEKNKDEIKKYIEFTRQKDVDILLFPELSLTGKSAGEMIFSDEIIDRAKNALLEIAKFTKDIDSFIVLGLPIKTISGIHSAMAVLKEGKIRNFIIRNREYNIYSNNSFSKDKIYYDLNGENILIISNLIYQINNSKSIKIIFEDEFNSSANNADILLIAGANYLDALYIDDLENILIETSKLNKQAIIYAGLSCMESSSNSVYGSQKFIIENGALIEKGKLFTDGLIYNEINLDELKAKCSSMNYEKLAFNEKRIDLRRIISKYPYFPTKENWDSFMRNILEIQSQALVRRLKQIPDKKIFLGLSGGLDSTLALIVASLAYSKLKLDSKDIHAITMPGLGTGKRTKNNAINLAKVFSVSFNEIPINDSVLQHFKDINHDENQYDTTFENAQARERTQILMDLANTHGGIVLGTGNMSEIALGWSTYNGDHMAMYSINSGLPKTLLREVVRFVKDSSDNELLKSTLSDIIDTPISPELLPTDEDGNMVQKTEDNIGPYELHDFFVYHLIKNRSKIENIYFMANLAFKDKYSEEIIEKYFKKFISRFLTQQFKRNVAVDSPAILDYSLNPKIGFQMPSDVDIDSLFYGLN